MHCGVSVSEYILHKDASRASAKYHNGTEKEMPLRIC